MKLLKDVDIPELYKRDLVEYAEYKEIDLEESINSILKDGVMKLYKDIVPKDRQSLVAKKLEKETSVDKSVPKPTISRPSMINTN